VGRAIRLPKVADSAAVQNVGRPLAVSEPQRAEVLNPSAIWTGSCRTGSGHSAGSDKSATATPYRVVWIGF